MLMPESLRQNMGALQVHSNELSLDKAGAWQFSSNNQDMLIHPKMNRIYQVVTEFILRGSTISFTFGRGNACNSALFRA
jgi:hypothetical protein